MSSGCTATGRVCIAEEFAPGDGLLSILAEIGELVACFYILALANVPAIKAFLQQ